MAEQWRQRKPDSGFSSARAAAVAVAVAAAAAACYIIGSTLVLTSQLLFSLFVLDTKHPSTTSGPSEF
jgi:hypothetical protein